MLAWSVNWILLFVFFPNCDTYPSEMASRMRKNGGKILILSMGNELDNLLIAAISCKGQFAGGDGLLASHCAQVHVIREELLQGEAEGTWVKNKYNSIHFKKTKTYRHLVWLGVLQYVFMSGCYMRSISWLLFWKSLVCGSFHCNNQNSCFYCKRLCLCIYAV